MMHYKNHLSYYLCMLAILITGTLLFAQNGQSRQMQVLIVFLTTFFFVGWAVMHHVINHDITSKIVIEYILMGLLGISIILFFLKGGLGI